jgi:hypothetical protein
VTAALALASLAALALAPAPSGQGAGAEAPRVALSISPTRVVLVTPSSRRLTVRNTGAERVVVDVTRRAVGRQQAAQKWLQIVPARLTLRPGTKATLTVRAKRAARAEPGDHAVLVLSTTRPVRGGRVNVQARLGIRIRMRVPGRVVRRVRFGALRVLRAGNSRTMLVSVANGGNVTVQLRHRVVVALYRRGQQLARLKPPARRALPPKARALVPVRYGGRVRGPVTAVVRVRLGSGLPVVERRYQIRL